VVQNAGDLGLRVGDEVFIADRQPASAQLGRALLIRIREQPPGDAGQGRLGPAHVRPGVVERGGQRAEVPTGRAQVTTPPVHLEPRIGDGPAIAHDMDEVRTGEGRIQQARPRPAGELVHEHLGRIQMAHPVIDEGVQSLVQPGRQIGGGGVGDRVDQRGGDIAADHAIPLARRQPGAALVGQRRRQPPPQRQLLGVALPDAEVVEVRHEADRGMAGHDLVDEGRATAAGADDEGRWQ
jgi:hypothetical protein